MRLFVACLNIRRFRYSLYVGSAVKVNFPALRLAGPCNIEGRRCAIVVVSEFIIAYQSHAHQKSID